MNERSTFAEPALLGNLTQDVLLPPSLRQRVTLEPGSQRVSQTADPSPLPVASPSSPQVQVPSNQ